MAPSLERLPALPWRLVYAQLARSDVLRLILVSRTLHDQLAPLLYTTVALRDDRGVLCFSNALMGGRGELYGAAVVELRFESSQRPDDQPTVDYALSNRVSALVPCMPRLRRFEWTSCAHPLTARLLVALAACELDVLCLRASPPGLWAAGRKSACYAHLPCTLGRLCLESAAVPNELVVGLVAASALTLRRLALRALFAAGAGTGALLAGLADFELPVLRLVDFRHLDTAGVSLCPEGLATLLRNARLTGLDLRCNDVDVTAERVATALAGQEHLRTLRLINDFGACTEAGKARLLAAISRLTRLATLELADVEQHARSRTALPHKALLQAIRDSPLLASNLVELHLGLFEIGAPVYAMIASVARELQVFGHAVDPRKSGPHELFARMHVGLGGHAALREIRLPTLDTTPAESQKLARSSPLGAWRALLFGQRDAHVALHRPSPILEVLTASLPTLERVAISGRACCLCPKCRDGGLALVTCLIEIERLPDPAPVIHARLTHEAMPYITSPSLRDIVRRWTAHRFDDDAGWLRLP